ncbi:MAG: hypothetical protein KDE27_05590, partial [Planctomycetes bacterium]|nr:hypothetical protein [Planctomycetota bacterium]
MPLRPGVLAAIAAVLVSSVDPIAQDPVAQDPGRPDHGLAAVCARGRLDAAFLAACRATVAAEVAAHALGRALPAGFFEPLDDDAVLAIAVHGPKVASNLALLRAHDPAAVTRYDQLAIAFAAAWASGDDAEPRRF